MSDAVKVKDHNNLRRDPHSQAIINVDKQEYVAYLKKQQRACYRYHWLVEPSGKL